MACSSGRLTRTLRNVVLLRPVKASASERAEPTTAPPSNGIASRAAKTADFVRYLAEGVLLCFAVVAFAAFAIIATGIGFFTGKVSWGLMIGVTAGIATMFGAPSIVAAISGQDTKTSCNLN